MLVTSNAIPNHNWLSAYAANADEQNMDWTIPLNPTEDTSEAIIQQIVQQPMVHTSVLQTEAQLRLR